MSKRYWENSAYRLAGHRVATNLQFLKITASAKHNKMRYACTHREMGSDVQGRVGEEGPWTLVLGMRTLAAVKRRNQHQKLE